jgi:hypothetical protein
MDMLHQVQHIGKRTNFDNLVAKNITEVDTAEMKQRSRRIDKLNALQ